MSNDSRVELANLLLEKRRREQYDKFHSYYFQDEYIDSNGNNIKRENYPKHMALIKATKNYKELAFIAANRTGKSELGAYKIAAHATKDYPDWWDGMRFPVGETLKIMVLGASHTAVRDVGQAKLLGTKNDIGSGTIPKDALLLDKCRVKAGVPDAYQDIYVKAIDGTITHIQFSSYDVDPQTLAGQELHVVWLDEEGFGTRIYNELLMRTMTTNGYLFCTFTPLDGITHSIMRFMPTMTFPPDGDVKSEDGTSLGRYIAHVGWDEVPHLTTKQKDSLRGQFFGDELTARTQGIPSIGQGQVYPFGEDEITCEPFAIPSYWEKAFGFDIAFNKTAAVWGARDPATNVVYIYSEYLGRREIPLIHADAVKSRGKWITGAIDPAAEKLIRPDDGKTILSMYHEYGLNLVLANNAVEGGIYMVGTALQTGSLKIFTTCTELLKQHRLYRRNSEGKIDKKGNPEDDLMDAQRYLMITGMDYAEPSPEDLSGDESWYQRKNVARTNASKVTGY